MDLARFSRQHRRVIRLAAASPRTGQAFALARILLALMTLVTTPALSTHAAGPGSPPKVYRDRVEPHWFADNQRFWYRNDLAGDSREFITVDVSTGTRQPAFDHARTATALGIALNRSLEASKLPIHSLEFGTDPKVLTLQTDEGAWKLNLETYTLAPEASPGSTERGLPVLPEPHASERAGAETAIIFLNRLDSEVGLFWVDNTGARQAYAVVKPGESRRQHTFAGHCWVVLRGTTLVAAFEAAPTPQRALIDGRAPDSPQQGRRDRNSRNPSENRPATPTAVRSPDGRFEAFVRDHNLWIRNTTNAAESQLSFNGNPGHSFHKDTQRARLVGMDYEEPEAPATLPEVFWAPDSRRLVALQTRSVPERRVQIVESSPRDQLQPRVISYPYLKAGDEIPTATPRLFDAVQAKEFSFDTDAFPNPWSLDDFRWAPDSARFTFTYHQRGHQVVRVLAVTPPASPEQSPALASISTLVNEVCPTFFDYSNKTFLHFLDASRELIWMSERSGWNHLLLIDAFSGTVRNAITQGEWVVRSIDKVDAEKRQIWFKACGIRPEQDPYHIHLARVNFDGSGLVILTEGDGTHDIQWSPDRQHFIDTWSRVDQPPITELRRSTDGTRVCELERADVLEVLAVRGRLPERFTAPGRDGTTPIWGIIHRPRDFDPGRRYPVIENIYAGPHGQHVPKAFRPVYRHQQEIADRGFVVVQIDGMGTNWRNKRFHDVAWRNLVDAGFPDRIAWLKSAAGRFPELDLSRVGIYGGSAGAQNALGALLTHGDFYKAGVADCGCHDNRMDKIWWNEAWMGWPVGPHYAEQSNVTLAHKLQGRLMLFVGELDKNVDPASTTQVVNALIKADKDFDFVLIPGAGHGSAESVYGRRRRAEFFQRHLGNPATKP